jgi:type VI secretion system Hcp family effector
MIDRSIFGERWLIPAILIIALLLLCPLAASQNLQENTNLPGADYRDFDLPSPDPQTCADECYNDPNCKAFTYVKPGYQGTKARCWLKGEVPSPEPNECCISGVKETEATAYQPTPLTMIPAQIVTPQEGAGQPSTESQESSGMGPGGSGGRDGYFLMISGVPGESQDLKHINWIDVTSFNHSMTSFSPSSSAGMGPAKITHSEIWVEKKLDKSSPKLYLALNNGQVLSEARLEVVKDGNRIMEYKLYNVRIEAVDITGPEGSYLPKERVALGYQRIEWTYTEIGADGSPKGDVGASWDLI